MKNLHILPTDKPSRLHKIGNELGLTDKPNSNFLAKQQNLYITSDEEIKDAKWIIHNGKIHEVTKNKGLYISVKEVSHIDIRADLCKKIILTTDPDLIKDGVQPIDDKFLEWFVKNPSCEEVEVEEEKKAFDNEHREIPFALDKDDYVKKIYKIIIPKEEPKQETLEEAADIGKFAEKKYLERLNNFQSSDFKDGVFEGAKWQAERMYSEEDVFNLCREFAIFVQRNGPSYKKQQEWFEQFKKK